MEPVDGSMPMIVRCLIVVLLAVLLAGCAKDKELLTTIPNGEAKIFEAPPYEVRGVTKYDQNWIDSQIEGGVAAFGWPRPAARPASIESKPALRPVQPARKLGRFKRAKAHIRAWISRPKKKDTANPDVWPNGGTAPPVAVPDPTAALPSQPRSPPAPRDPVDELLTPSEPVPAVRIVR